MTSQRGGRPSVLVAGDDPVARGGLARLLAGEVSVVGEGSVAEAAALLPVLRPNAVVWIVGEQTLTGVGVPYVAVVDDEDGAGALIARGASGVLSRRRAHLLPGAVAAVARGLVVLDRELAALALRSSPVARDAGEPLTPREADVLEGLGEALSNKEIAAALDISEHTVKFHINTIYRKLGVESRTEAVVRAARLGLLSL